MNKIEYIENLIRGIAKDNKSIKSIIFDPNANLSLNNLKNTWYFLSEKDFGLYLNSHISNNSYQKVVFMVDYLNSISPETKKSIKNLVYNCQKSNIAVINLSTIN